MAQFVLLWAWVLFHLKVIKWHELHITTHNSLQIEGLKAWKKYNKIMPSSFAVFFFFLQRSYLEHMPWVVTQKNETITWIISFQRFKSTEAPLATDLLLHTPKPVLVHIAKLRPVACESRILYIKLLIKLRSTPKPSSQCKLPIKFKTNPNLNQLNSAVLLSWLILNTSNRISNTYCRIVTSMFLCT